MNHGLINAKYYLSSSKSKYNKMYEDYPQLVLFKNYFSRLKARDTYYMVMKYYAIMLSMEIYPQINLKQLADVINLTNHASVLNLKNNFKKPFDYDHFVEKFDYLIENFYYPITEKIEKKRHEECYYKLVHIPGKPLNDVKVKITVGKKKIKNLPLGNKKIPAEKH